MGAEALKNAVSVVEALSSLQGRLSVFADPLLSGGRLAVRGGRRDLLDDAFAEMDRTAIEARQVESHLVRLVLEMDQETQRLIAPLQQPKGAERRPGFWGRFRLREPERAEADKDRRAIVALVALLRETGVLLGALEDHRSFLRALLLRCEQALDEALVRVRSVAGRPEGNHVADDLQPGIDLLQELVDRIIGLIGANSLLINKLSVDAEERVIVLSGLRFVLDEGDESVPKLAYLFRRAERGLLSLKGLSSRKARINEAFRFRLNASRQAATA